jgi:arylsulfatase A-like enzyme
MGQKGTFAKHCLWEEATNAPLMFAGPGVARGKIINQPVEMLSIYPTLLELCGLPAYERNEGESLVDLLVDNPEEDPEAVAITTFGMNNHGVRSNLYRYIQYEDGTEEFYNRKNDPNEWENQSSKESDHFRFKSPVAIHK